MMNEVTDQESALLKLSSLSRFGVRPGLEREKELLRRLGNPQLTPGLRFAHLAGTNGKGSCGAMLQSMLRAGGLKTGFFSSPHLLDHRERYRINGRMLPQADFVELFSEVWQALESMVADGWESPTEFEAVTALSLLWFSREEVDIAVMECGLGGLYDSTNVIPSELAIITNVAFDHMDYLGHTLPEIAAQKAGIIHPGQQVVTAAGGEVLPVIECQSAQCSDLLLTAGRDFTVSFQSRGDAGLLLDIRTTHNYYQQLQLPLIGSFQAVNAACAVQGAELLGLDEAAIRQGLERVIWPCRLEVVSRAPLVVIDGAHNEDGMQALAKALDDCWPNRRICGLLGMLDDKQRESALAHLVPRLSSAVVTRPGYWSRSQDWQQTARPLQEAGLSVSMCEDAASALQMALKQLECGQADMLLIGGSLYLAADLRGRFPLSPDI